MTTVRVSDTWKLSVALDNGSVAVNPTTITLTITNPNGVVTAPFIANPPAATGQFLHDETIDLYGRWIAVWKSTNPDVERTEILDVPPPAGLTEPSSQEISDVLPRRANVNGTAVSGFSAATVPTDDTVEEMGRFFASEVDLAAGGVLPASITSNPTRLRQLQSFMRWAAALGAASQIELSYFGESSRNSSDALWTRYQDALAQLRSFVTTPEGVVPMPETGTTPGGAANFNATPVFSFPDALTLELGY